MPVLPGGYHSPDVTEGTDTVVTGRYAATQADDPARYAATHNRGTTFLKSFCDKHFKPNSTEPKNTSIAGPKSNCIYCRICGQSDSNHPNIRCQIFSQ